MILECVPNISEGRDEEIINQIISAMKGVDVKNLHMDPDHNRSVITIFGEPLALEEAVFQMTLRAVQLLDINSHAGVHPFIGVVDVIPFIPYKDATMRDAGLSAHNLGKRLWSELKLPVYFYGEAAKVDARKDLPYVRKGGYRSLKSEIDLPERNPDVGHGLHVTAGATAVGARNFLIAFNVNIKTDDLSIATSIARNIREKHGGLKGVRALGLPLESRGITQVSVNLVDHKETTLRQVFGQVKAWAKEYQVEVLESEIVGMIPPDAYFEGMQDVLKINNFSMGLLI